MDLGKKWLWDKRKIAGNVHQSNPGFDDLRERLAELAGVNLKDLLDDMKRTQLESKAKKRTAMMKSKSPTPSSMAEVSEDLLDVPPISDYEVNKKYKEILHRSHIVDATQSLVQQYDETNTLGMPTGVAAKNIQKRFISTIPKSPPNRIAAEIRREMAKSIVIPNPEDTKAASMKLQRKLAKQRAARKSQIAGGDSTQMEVESDDDTPPKKQKRLPKWDASIGFIAGPGQEFLDGMMYLARMADSAKKAAPSSSGGQRDAESDSKEVAVKAKEKEAAAKAVKDEETQKQENALELERQTRGVDDSDALVETDREAKLYCAKALCNWTRNPANAKRLAGEGAIRALIHLAAEPIPKILFYCAGAFRFMSEHHILATTMIDEGAIPAVADLVKADMADDRDVIIGNLTITLVNLTRVNGKEGQVVESMIHQVLTVVLQTYPELSSACARGLYNLTCVDNSYPFIEKVLRALVQLASTTPTSSVKHICAAALCNLADMKPIRSRLLEEGVVSVLNSLAKGSETRTRRVVAVILQNISASKACRVDMVARSGVQCAHSLSSNTDPIILRCVGLTLSRLASEPTNASRIIHELGIAALCNIAVKFPTIPGISQPVATAFQLLSGNELVRVAIVQEGSVPAVAALLKNSTDVYTIQHCLLCICNMLLEADNHLPVVQQGLIHTLVTLSGHENSTVKDFCSLAFLNLSMVDESRKHAVNAGAVVAIISLAREDSTVARARCAAAMMNLSTGSYTGSVNGLTPAMDRMVADGVIGALMDLLSTDSNDTVRYACAALCRICVTPTTGMMIMDSGAIPILVRRAMQGDPQTQQYCGAVLSSLSFYESCRVQLFEMDIIAALKKLSEVDDDLSKQRCLAAFSNLSCEGSIRLKVVEQGVVGIITELADSYQESTYTYCARALCNLACAEGARLRVAKEGGMRVLLMISMVRSVDVNTKYWCVVALLNLLDMTSIDYMLEEGLIASIANVSRNLPTDDTVQCCARIFNYLTAHPLGRLRMIEKVRYLHALYSMINSPVNETRILATRTTSNLLFSPDTRGQAIEAGALHTLQSGIISGDADASLHCLKALFSACQEVQLMPIVAQTSLPVALCAFATDCQGDRHDLAVKVLLLLAWLPESRQSLLKRPFAEAFFRLVTTNLQPSSLDAFALISRYICTSYATHEELLEVGVLGAVGVMYNADPTLSPSPSSSFKTTDDASTTVASSLAAIVRCLSQVEACQTSLATPTTVDMLSNIVAVCSDEDTVYDVGVTLYNFASSTADANRRNTASLTTVGILELLGTFPLCLELVAVITCHYLTDLKSRKIFANRQVIHIVLQILQNSPQNDVLYNGVTCLFLVSKRADCVALLSDLTLGAMTLLLTLAKCDDPRVRANCARTLKNLTTDSTEELGEGAVASLLSMYYEGNDRMVLEEAVGLPAIAPQPTDDLRPPQCQGEEITDTLWFAAKVSASGGPAGKGPPPPEPPKMSSEESGSYTSIIDDAEPSDDSRTKMSFAKMQTPLALRDQCLLTDAHFEMVREGVNDDEWVEESSLVEEGSVGGDGGEGEGGGGSNSEYDDDYEEFEEDGAGAGVGLAPSPGARGGSRGGTGSRGGSARGSISRTGSGGGGGSSSSSKNASHSQKGPKSPTKLRSTVTSGRISAELGSAATDSEEESGAPRGVASAKGSGSGVGSGRLSSREAKMAGLMASPGRK